MFNRQSIHIAMLMWGFIFSVIAALCMFMSYNFDREKRKRMIWMQICTAGLLVSDSLAWAFRGYPGEVGYYMVRISNFLVFLLSDVLLFLFHSYICCYLFEEKKEKENVLVRSVYLLSLLAQILVIFSQFTDLYYYFDDANFYHRNTWNSLSFALPMLGMIVDLILIIRRRKMVSYTMLVAMISYIFLPLIMLIVQIFYYGVSLINIGISISMILMFVVCMMEQNQNLAKKENEAAELRISLLMSQIAPHFIYNALTVIQRLCVKDPTVAQKTVKDFARYLRGNLDSLEQKQPISFDKELEHVKSYLNIEKERFGERLHIQYDIREVDFLIPALTLQVVVENAVKHGICRKEEGGTITITTQRKQKTVSVIVQDDGVGFDPDEVKKDGKTHVGIQNAKARLHNMCGGMLKITSESGKGTTAVIELIQEGSKYEDSDCR
ncbi:MAG: sensor histidine kinase [Eubacterium sp.]